ncbi:hypothetical protein B0H10DRAFT_2217247 [Mycena sp. CBHHK59/15]|nr:hypothetical protein B0H10DRAFT_2217247 [Mycena sp. CBHHK59/15]
MDGICKVLDGVDLVAVTPTRSGKTAYLFLTILVMMAISKTPLLCPAINVLKDPAIVVVCPTNSIEQQIDANMEKLGVPALTINSDTVAAARLRGEDLWKKVSAGIPMLILGPEQLISKGFRLTASLLADVKVQNAIFAFLGVNHGEFHLIRRSNARHDIQFLFHQLYSGIDGRVFPEIAWVLDSRDKFLMFSGTISLV